MKNNVCFLCSSSMTVPNFFSFFSHIIQTLVIAVEEGGGTDDNDNNSKIHAGTELYLKCISAHYEVQRMSQSVMWIPTNLHKVLSNSAQWSSSICSLQLMCIPSSSYSSLTLPNILLSNYEPCQVCIWLSRNNNRSSCVTSLGLCCYLFLLLRRIGELCCCSLFSIYVYLGTTGK